MINLTVVNLNKNLINRFDPIVFTEGTPNLKELYLSENKIEVLEDIIDIGSLKHLEVLDF